MVKHDGVYWYRKNGEWVQVPKVAKVARATRWPTNYQRTTCKRCHRRLVSFTHGAYCSVRCEERATATARPVAEASLICSRCGKRLTHFTYEPWCSAQCRSYSAPDRFPGITFTSR